MDFLKDNIKYISGLKKEKSKLVIEENVAIDSIYADIGEIITYTKRLDLRKPQLASDKVIVSGDICISILYKRDADEEVGEELCQAKLIVPFKDNVHVGNDGCYEKVLTNIQVEDVSIKRAGRRKVIARLLLDISVALYNCLEEDIITGIENGNGIETCSEALTTTKGFDTELLDFNIDECYELPKNKPNIGKILWKQFRIRKSEERVSNEKLIVKMDTELFVIYSDENEENPYQYLIFGKEIVKEFEIESFDSDTIDLNICLQGTELSIADDDDMEPRKFKLSVAGVIEVRGYSERRVSEIRELYSPSLSIETDKKDICYSNVLLHNNAVVKVKGSEVAESQDILQICYSDGDIVIDSKEVVEESGERKCVLVRGIVRAYVIYICSSDEVTFKRTELSIPFENRIDAGDVNEKDHIKLTPVLEEIDATIAGGREITVTANVILNTFIIREFKDCIITGAKFLPIDEAAKEKSPNLCGYIVRADDNIWKIAKKYYTTTEAIRTINNLTDDNLYEGQKLLLLKQ